MARAHQSVEYIHRLVMMMQCYLICSHGDSVYKSPRRVCDAAYFFRLLFRHLHARVAVVLAIK